MNELEAEFHREMVSGAQRLQKEIGYRPTRFQQMLSEFGGVETAKRLLSTSDTSDGFTTLWEANKLGLSIEAFVLLPRYHALFSDDERRTARLRLEQYRFDVDGFLRQVGDGLP